MGPQQQVPMWSNPYMLNPFGQVIQQQPTIPPSQMMMANQPMVQQPAQPQSTFVQGRVVESEADIRPNEIPMDGSVTLFPKSDYSVIFGKTWTRDGTIKPMRFVLEQDAPKPEGTESQAEPPITAEAVTQIIQDQFQSLVNDYLKPINEALSKLPKSSTNLVVP